MQYPSEAIPEYGIPAYTVVLGAWLLLLPASGLLNSTGIFQAWLFEHQLRGCTESEVAWIFSVFAFLFFFGGLGVGPVFENHGEKALVKIVCLGVVVGLVGVSCCRSYYQFMPSFGCLCGLSSSILWTSSIATLGHWFHTNRGLATRLATTAGGFGGVLYPIMFSRLVVRMGFAWTMRCFALLSACCFLLGVMLLTTRLPRSLSARITLDWRCFQDMRFLVTMAAIFVLDWAVLVPPAYITTYAGTMGLEGVARHILVMLNAASIFGRGFPGPVADRVGRFNVMVMCSAACTLSIFGLWFGLGTSVAGLVVFAIIYGFFSGSAYSLTPVWVSQLCDAQEYASKYGTAYGIVSFATLAGVPLSVTILSVGGERRYDALILFCGATYAASTLLFVVARGVSTGWALRAKF